MTHRKETHTAPRWMALSLIAVASCSADGSVPAAVDGGLLPGDAETTIVDATLTDGQLGPDGTAVTGRYLPLAVGARWTYRVTNLQTNGVRMKNQRIVAFEDIGGRKAGIMAYRQRTEKGSGRVTVSWHEDTGAAILRHKEQVFDSMNVLELEEFFAAHKVRIDETPARLVVGATWVDDYVENATDFTMGSIMTTTTKSDQWTLEAVGESVTVPAGTFSCIRLRREGLLSPGAKTYWFARGVGKIKEQGNKLEELMSYSMP